MGKLSSRYAKALIQIAQEKDKLKIYEEELIQVLDILNKNKILYSILIAPENSKESKQDIINSLLKKNTNIEIINLLRFLIEKERLNILSEICFDYKEQVKILTDTAVVIAISAYNIDENEEQKIKDKLKKHIKVSNINLIKKIDRDIIGGIKFIIGNKIIDNTVAGMISVMKNQVTLR